MSDNLSYSQHHSYQQFMAYVFVKRTKKVNSYGNVVFRVFILFALLRTQSHRLIVLDFGLENIFAIGSLTGNRYYLQSNARMLRLLP